VDVVGVDGRKRLGSGLADQPEVISEREQVAGFFSFGRTPTITSGLQPNRNAR